MTFNKVQTNRLVYKLLSEGNKSIIIQVLNLDIVTLIGTLKLLNFIYKYSGVNKDCKLLPAIFFLCINNLDYVSKQVILK